MNKIRKLLSIYQKHPCRTLPNAFWKTAARLEKSRLIVTRTASGVLSSLVIWEGNRLMTFWCADPADHPLTHDEITGLPFGLVHQDALLVFNQRNFAHQQPYFRLVHSGTAPIFPCTEGFGFQPVLPECDLAEVVDLLRVCYPDFKLSIEIVRGWLRHPVYDPSLWLWVVDLKTGVKAGLGIAELDRKVLEASLEWIQVLPDYRGKGLGVAIVAELLHRVSGQVRFTTVSGKADNPYQPEGLYRRCGFTGEDIWWLLSDEQ